VDLPLATGLWVDGGRGSRSLWPLEKTVANDAALNKGL
jgi:hypothetical protein